MQYNLHGNVGKAGNVDNTYTGSNMGSAVNVLLMLVMRVT